MTKVCVLGGTGFVGKSVVAQLHQAGYAVRVLTRRREHAKSLFVLPQIEIMECDVQDDAKLRSALEGCHAVINLIGILHAQPSAGFNAMHAHLPARLARICQQVGINRLLQMSALCADVLAPSQYLQSKGKGEQALRTQPVNFRWTIFQPSIIFGYDDNFINLFANMIKWMPVVFLVKPQAKFQPVWVEDVAAAFVTSIDNPTTYHQTYPLAGPKVYSFKQIVQYIAQVLGCKRAVVGLNDTLSYMQAWMLEQLPIKLMTRDNLLSLQVDNVSKQPFPAVFGITPTAMEAVVPQYLQAHNARDAYLLYRAQAGR